GLPDDGALGHRLVLQERRLDLERPDPVRSRQDHVVGATGEPEVAVLVASRAVTGHVPVTPEDGRGLVRRAEVLEEQTRWAAAQRDIALLADCDLAALTVDHGHLVAWRR